MKTSVQTPSYQMFKIFNKSTLQMKLNYWKIQKPMATLSKISMRLWLRYCLTPSASAVLVSSHSEDKSRALLNTCRLVFPAGNPVALKQGPRLHAFTRPLPCLECVPRASSTLRDLAFHQLCRGPWCPPPFDCRLTFASCHASLDA